MTGADCSPTIVRRKTINTHAVILTQPGESMAYNFIIIVN